MVFHNLFAKNRKNELSAGPFNHCATVCPSKRGALIAWYAGSSECRNDQSVHIMFTDKNRQTTPKRLGDKTGNPVLIPYGKDAVLLWSKFEDTGFIRNIVERWKYCSLWLQHVKFDGEVRFIGDPKKLAGPEKHMLGRCSPIVVNGQYFLPLYDEVGRQGVMYRGDGWDFECVGRIGNYMIQPTLWHDGDRTYSLSRNFGTQQSLSMLSYSDDNGETWSTPEATKIRNNNSSLHAVKWNGKQLLLWNNTKQRSGVDITLGVIDGFDANSVYLVDDYGAYPSMCVDNNGDLNMVYSSNKSTIIHHVWNRKFYRLATSKAKRDLV